MPERRDRLVVTEPDASTIIVSLNGKPATYVASDVTGIRFRGHAGDDSATAKGTSDLLFGGTGKDTLFAGAGDDLPGGGPGADALFGEEGFDLFYDGMGDDTVDLGPDGGEILTTPGSDDIFINGSGEGTLNFSQDDQPITLDLDSTAVQQVDPNANTIRLIGEWLNLVGSPFDDTLRVKATGLPRRLNGGSGNDQLNDLTGLAELPRRFTIRNNGPGNLNLDTITVDGPDFSLFTAPGANELRRFEVTQLELQLLTNGPGAVNGQMRIPTNDSAIPLFQFGLTALVVEDNTPPTVLIIVPPGGTSFVVGPTMVVVAEADDDLGVACVEFLVNGQSFVDHSAPFRIDFPFAVGQLPPTLLNVQVTAFDLSGDSAVDTRTFRVEPDAPPRVELQMPTNGANPFLEDVRLPVIVDAINSVGAAPSWSLFGSFSIGS